jgi:hypothetical protein
MIADRIERLRELLLFLPILALSHCCIMHTSQHSSDQRQRIIGCVLAAPASHLLMHVTMVAAFL